MADITGRFCPMSLNSNQIMDCDTDCAWYVQEADACAVALAAADLLMIEPYDEEDEDA